MIYTIEDIFVDLKDMGCVIEIYPDPLKDVDEFNKFVVGSPKKYLCEPASYPKTKPLLITFTPNDILCSIF